MSEADSAHARFLAARRFPSLDGLRALAVVPVVWHHATPRPLEGLLGRGPLGVDLFFAVSGFLITTLLLRERRATGAIALGRFYARRALRIMPLYYLVLALYAVRALFLLPESPARAHFLAALPFHATYTANLFVDYAVPHPVIFAFGWSLAVEEQFYAVWPPLLAGLRRGVTAFLAMAVVVALDVALEGGHLASVFPIGGFARRALTSFAAPIGLGALVALALDAPRGFRWLGRSMATRHASALILATLAALIAWSEAPLLAIHAAMAALVGACAAREDHAAAHMLAAAPLRFVGEVSYGVYLVHVAVITAVKLGLPGEAPAGVVFAFALPLSLALAALTYRLVERPLLGLRARLRVTAP